MKSKMVFLLKKYKKIFLYTTAGATLASWIAVGTGLAFGVEDTILIIMLTIAAIVTEVLFWAVAVVFGISVFESRKKIGRWVKSKLRLGKTKKENV